MIRIHQTVFITKNRSTEDTCIYMQCIVSNRVRPWTVVGLSHFRRTSNSSFNSPPNSPPQRAVKARSVHQCE